ncbi:hypothetical protein Scep_029768 [Stephania cephalantha]|uniref:Uncharacterized protein n=1 Tax=Stephania cephalantha TaxID=152367 RepID=A0AAP0E2U9_9MAGN
MNVSSPALHPLGRVSLEPIHVLSNISLVLEHELLKSPSSHLISQDLPHHGRFRLIRILASEVFCRWLWALVCLLMIRGILHFFKISSIFYLYSPPLCGFSPQSLSFVYHFSFIPHSNQHILEPSCFFQ